MLAQRRADDVPGEVLIRFQRAVELVRIAIVLAALAFAGSTAFAQPSQPAVAPPSAWVVPVRSESQFNLDPADPSLNSRWVLAEKQVNAANDEQFFHWMRQALTPAGVSRASHIAIPYDPAYESLTMHWVRIWRGTNALNRLDTSSIQIIPRGPDTGDFLSGTKHLATFILDGVRPGDIVDYAYSIDGINPLMNGLFADQVLVQFEDPVNLLVTRLFWPAARKVYVQDHGTDIYPATVYRSNTVEFTWSARKVPALILEPPTPAWYNPYPWVQLSEFQKWSEVNQWALKVFPTNNPLSPELAKKIDDCKQLAGPDEQARAAVQFVQDEIRNTGAEGGEGSAYLPSTPSTILARRYGDSRDKAWLLTTLLRALGIDACPVLVNTRERQTIVDLHPSPTVFNHAIVEATLNDRTYYLDPTATFERGPVANRSWPDFGYGLAVRPGTTALSILPPCPVQPKTTVSEYFNIGGFEQETGLNVITVAEGPDANALREHFSTTPFERIEREYLGAQAEYYPEIHATAPLQFNDDEQINRFTVTGTYSIPKFWRRRPEDYYYHCNFYSFNVDDAIHKPEPSARAMPLGVDYPVHQLFHAEANWVVGWPVRPDTQNIQNPAFSFVRTMNIVGTNLVMDFDYRSLSDAVMPAAFPAYVQQMSAVSKVLDCAVVSY